MAIPVRAPLQGTDSVVMRQGIDRGTDLLPDFREAVGSKLSAARVQEPAQTGNDPPSRTATILDSGIRTRVQPVPRPATIPSRYSLQALQEWEGYVVEISNDRFTATLVDITAGEQGRDELAEFPLSDVSDDDRDVLAEGAVFRWVIGYQRSPAGTKRRVSELIFRRLPAWTSRDLQRAEARSDALAGRLIWE